MIELNGKKICENCFSELEGKFCTQCGYNAEVSGFDPLVLKPGSILRGKYIIGKCLGKGGFGVTYLAYDTKADRKVAIKEFFPFGQALRIEGDPTVSVSTEENAAVFKIGAEKFYEEAKLVSRFNGNPNIVSVYEFFYENDTVYFSMEYLSGRTLKDYVQKIGKLTPAQAHLIALNVSSALMVAHSASVLHRDISPDNIMLCNNGEIKLIDFGAARQVIAEHSQTFSVILKPGFAPLEQYQKKGKQGPWTDIYSLGATLYYALTGNIPDDPMSRQEEDETFSENKFNIDEELWAIIVKATAMRVPDRYQDVYALRKDLSGLSYSAEPFVVPDEDKAESERPTFRTATVRTARTGEVSAAAAAVQTVPEIQENKSGSRKKAIIGIVCGAAAAVVAAAVILVFALNSGNKPNPGEMVDNGVMNNSSANSLPVESDSDSEPVNSEPAATTPQTTTTVATTPQTTTTAATTPKTTTTPATTPKTTTTPATTPKTTTTPATTPKTTTTPATTPKPATTTPKPATTTPKTTTTKKPAEPKPVEVKEVTICGRTYTTDTKEIDVLYTTVIGDNTLTDSEAKKLKEFPNVTKLLLKDVSTSDLSWLKYVPNLEELQIRNLSAEDFSGAKNTNLKTLKIWDSTAVSLSGIDGLSSLEDLYYSNRGYTRDISALGSLTSLKKLVIGDFGIISDYSSLKKLKNCVELEISFYAGNDLKFLSGMKSLKKLDIRLPYNSELKSIAEIGNLENLEMLLVCSCNLGEDKGEIPVTPLKKLKKLTHLNIAGNEISDISTLDSIVDSLPKLTHLNFGNNRLSDQCEESFMESHPDIVFNSSTMDW